MFHDINHLNKQCLVHFYRYRQRMTEASVFWDENYFRTYETLSLIYSQVHQHKWATIENSQALGWGTWVSASNPNGDRPQNAWLLFLKITIDLKVSFGTNGATHIGLMVPRRAFRSIVTHLFRLIMTQAFRLILTHPRNQPQRSYIYTKRPQ